MFLRDPYDDHNCSSVAQSRDTFLQAKFNDLLSVMKEMLNCERMVANGFICLLELA